MEEVKGFIPDLGTIEYADGKKPDRIPEVRVIKCGKESMNDAPIEVKRTIRSGFRTLKPGEPIDWRKEYC